MRLRSALFLLLVLACTQHARSQSLIDTLDGYPDMSELMNTAYGVMPVVQPFNEPAVGFGVAGGLMYLHTSSAEMRKHPGRPPTMSVLGGMYTTNGSWSGVLYHQQPFANDRIRTRGFIAYASINLTYYPKEAVDSTGAPVEVDFNIEGVGLSPKAEFRIADWPLFAGVEYTYFANTVQPDLDQPGTEDTESSTRLGGLGGSIRLNTLNNAFTPSSGADINTKLTHYDTWLGGTETYTNYRLTGFGYYDPMHWLILGAKADYQLSFNGRAPIWALPFVQMRGAPALRYLGHRVVSAEAEVRVNVSRRWGLVAFGGYGRASEDVDLLEETLSEDVVAGGGGIRYLVARLTGLYVGLDLAHSQDGTTFYIIVGSAWRTI